MKKSSTTSLFEPVHEGMTRVLPPNPTEAEVDQRAVDRIVTSYMNSLKQSIKSNSQMERQKAREGCRACIEDNTL